MWRVIRSWLLALVVSAAVLAPALAGPTSPVLPGSPLAGAPGWVLWPAQNGVDINFAAGQYWLEGSGGVPPSDSRASAATCIDASGSLHQFAAYQTAICPGTGAAAFEGRTNSVRNSTMQGAVIGVVGSGGALPTNWNVASAVNLTTSVVALSTINGMSCSDIGIAGNATSTPYLLSTEVVGSVAAAYGQSWSVSAAVAIVGGSTTNITSIAHRIRGYTSGASPNDASAGTNILSLLTASPQIFSESYTVSSGTASLVDQFLLGVNVGPAINVTLRICAPQLELNPNIPASVASATVAGGGTLYVGTSGTMTYNGTGCSTNPVLNVTASGGAITGVTSVATAGVCAAASGLPVAGSTAWTPGGGLSVGSGASFTLTPTNNAAQAFATPPILTSGSAQARLADNITMPTQPCSGQQSLYAIATPSVPAVSITAYQSPVTLGTGSNYLALFRTAPSGFPQAWADRAGTFVSVTPAGTWATGVSGKVADTVNGSNLVAVYNNGAALSAALAGTLTTKNILSIGSFFSSYPWNGMISRVAYSCGQSLLNN